MPELDFMVVCDFVRVDNGVFHIIGGGIDRIRPANVPNIHNLCVAARVSLTRDECGHEHELQVVFHGEDGPIFDIRGPFKAVYPTKHPTGWPVYGAVPMRLALPLAKYGEYSLHLLIDGTEKKSAHLLVEPQSPDEG